MNSEEIVNGLKKYLLERVTDPAFAKEFLVFIKALKSLPSELRIFSEESAKIGWFATSDTFLGEMKKSFDVSQENLDAYMIEEISFNYQSIKSTLLDSHPKRKEILECAFKLHEEENWIACIPLFLTQAEGIFCEHTDAYLFSGKERRKDCLQSKFKEHAEAYMPYLYAPFEAKTQFASNNNSCSPKQKRNGPNRNGILHGDNRHLDYGSKLNSYKCISLLSYLSMVFVGLETKT